MSKLIRKIKQIDYHRNGIGGEGFYAVLFSTTKDGGDKENMLATVFPAEGHCAVIDLDLVPEYGVTFGANSWRGDNYEPELRAAIKAYEARA